MISRQVALPAESRAGVITHGFWKPGTTAMFYIIIVNLDVVSYLCMTHKKALAKTKKSNNYLYLQDCLDCRCYFTPMVYSGGGNSQSGGTIHTENISHTNQLQVEVGII